MAASQSAFNYVIYRDGSGYHMEDRDGNLLASDPQWAESVIQSALNQLLLGDPHAVPSPGHIYIQSGEYYLSPDFQGFDVSQATRLTLDPTALIRVSVNYDGFVFRLRSVDHKPDVMHCIIDGGSIEEKSPPGSPTEGQDPSRLWTGLLLEGATTSKGPGVLFNTFTNMRIFDAAVAVKLLISGQEGWVNSNNFQSLKLWNCKTFIDFVMADGITYPRPTLEEGIVQDQGFYMNMFYDVQCQRLKGDTDLIIGVNNIRHMGNTFIGVVVWDLVEKDLPSTLNNISATIHETATNTLIVGGIMTDQNFEDRGQSTRILDHWQGLKVGNQPFFPMTATSIGAASDEKLGFFGQTPIPQQQGAPSTNAGPTYTANEQSMLQAVYQAMKAYGLIRA